MVQAGHFNKRLLTRLFRTLQYYARSWLSYFVLYGCFSMPSKPKTNQPQTPDSIQVRDDFQTPLYAITDVLVPFLGSVLDMSRSTNPSEYDIWDGCAGKLRQYPKAFARSGYTCKATDLLDGEQYNFLTYQPDFDWKMFASNVPFSIKDLFVQRLIKYFDKPFGVLIPADWSSWIIESINDYDCQLIVPNRRISYITPNMCDVVFRNETLKNFLKAHPELKKQTPKIKFADLSESDIQAHAGTLYPNIESIPNPVLYANSQAQFHSMYLTRKLNLPERLNFVNLSLESMKTNIL